MDINKENYIAHKLCKAATLTLVRQIGKHATIELAHIGLDNDLVIQLGELTPREQEYVTEHAREFIRFSVDNEALQKALNLANKEMSIFEMEDQFIALGATARMMRRLFGLHSAVFSARRRRLNMAGLESHRPSYCDEKTERYLWDLWEKYRGTDERGCYLKMADLSGQKLNVIWQAIEKYQDGFGKR